MIDPFADKTNQAAASEIEVRASLLDDARRGYAQLRKVFVQRPREEQSRPSILGQLVKDRQELALRLFLLIVALEPLADLKLPTRRWAGMIGSETKPCTSAQLGRALTYLQERELVAVEQAGRTLALLPKLEDGSGADYVRPSAKGADVGKGYFTIPHYFWTSGLADRLRLPGTAMFLVCLHDTHQESAFQVSLEQMSQWYGISERTAERGYRELLQAGVLLTHPQTVRDRTRPEGIRTITWRALTAPYSQDARAAAQASSRTASRRKATQPR